MKRLIFLLLTTLLITAWQGGERAQAQTDDTISGRWTAFPIIGEDFGVVGSFGVDRTEDPRTPIDLTLSEDGRQVELPTVVLEEAALFSVPTLHLARIDNGVYRATIDVDPCPADSIDCFGNMYTIELQVISEDQMALYFQFLQFEAGRRTKTLLMRGDVTDPDPLAAEFSAPRCPGAPVSRMVAGQTLGVMYEKGLNVRQKPAKSGAKVGSLDFQDQAVALDGPVCADGFQYWHVQLSSGKTGWAAEGTGKDYWMVQETYIPLFNFDTSSSQFRGVFYTMINNRITDEQLDAPTMRGQ